jgi:glycosyltransferase involved in cell wall biosynthesis
MRKHMKHSLLFFALSILTPLHIVAHTDLIVYSYDRPMQLYALLESIQKYVIGLATTTIIVRASNEHYNHAYQEIEHDFPKAQFIYQAPPYTDFQQINNTCIEQSKSPYILFGVDDIIVKDVINLDECIAALEKSNAHGFFLRLGTNLDYCFALSSPQAVPPLQEIKPGIYSWQFCQAEHDWRYPNNLDFTVYRTSEIKNALKNAHYQNPNALESQFMCSAHLDHYGLCYQASKIVNLPLNMVQTFWPNNCGNTYTTQKLLELFNQGLKIDITKLYQIANKSAHMLDDTLISFIPRTAKTNEKLIVIVTPSYNNKEWWEWNLISLINQNYANYYILITDDCSPDSTGNAIEKYINEHNLHHKVHLTKNKERVGALHNLYTMIHSCPDNAIVITVDGDDALPHNDVLTQLNTIYSTHDVWLTYGQFAEYPSGAKGWCSPMPPHIVEHNAFRHHQDLPSHLRTFYAWLFKRIKLEDMLYYGEFYRMTWDYVMMLPMIEMAGKHHLCINEVMYLYNNTNSISDHKISRQLQAHLAQIVRAKQPYEPLSTPQENTRNYSQEKADLIIFAEDCNPAFLDICLSSIEKNLQGLGNSYVLYVYSPDTAEKYQTLKHGHGNTIFLEIDQNRSNFKDLLSCIYHHMSENKYVLFCLPSIKVEESINLATCIQMLEETHAYAFSLKLSKEKPYKPIPSRMPLLEIAPDICAWNYATAHDAWACANTVDMTLYRRDTPYISHILQYCWMYSWVHFVGWWAHEGNLDKIGLCFNQPKVSILQ